MEATVKEAIERLAEQLARGHSQEFLDLLSFYSKLHRYSPRNIILIREQRPDATRVAGYTTWTKLGRQVKHGTKAIWLWAPLIRKETVNGVEQEKLVGYRPAPVFAAEDLENIESDPLPNLYAPLPDDMESLFQRCVKRVEATGVTVQEQILKNGVQGVSRGTEFIIIHRKLDSRNRLFVLCHELVHQRHHQTNRERADVSQGQAEFEAESVSYVVAATMGLDHPSAADYLINWGATPEKLHDSLGVIQRLVKDVCAILDVAGERHATA